MRPGPPAGCHPRASAADHRRPAAAPEEAGHHELLGWTWELAAWWSIVGRQYRRAIDAARKGRSVAPAVSSAMVQLNVQEAYASSRLGAPEATHDALRRAAAILPVLPPDDTRNHFVFDPAKLSFYAGHCHVVLGEADRGEQLAREVIEQCGGRWTTRILEAHIDLGLALVQQGRPDEAAAAGAEALAQGPLCTTTLWRGEELDRALRTADPTPPDAPGVSRAIDGRAGATDALRPGVPCGGTPSRPW